MRITGQETIADMIGVAPKTIVEWQEQGFPIAQRGSRGIASEYDSVACIAWLVEREVRKVQNESPLDELNREKTKTQRMINAKMMGELVSIDELEPKLEAMAITAREWLDGLSGGLAARLVGKPVREIQQLLAEAHGEFLSRLSNWRAEPADLDDEADASGHDGYSGHDADRDD